MKNKKTIIISVVVAVFLLLILIVNIPDIIWNIKHPHDAQGNYYSIDDLREDIDRDNKKSSTSTPTYYENCEYLFSKDFNDIIVDFVIKDNLFIVVRINCIKESNVAKYGMLSSESTRLDYMVNELNDKNNYNWHKVLPGILSPANSTQVQWCIVNESSGLYDEKYESFKFEYSGETYYILYEVISNK